MQCVSKQKSRQTDKKQQQKQKQKIAERYQTTTNMRIGTNTKEIKKKRKPSRECVLQREKRERESECIRHKCI